MKSLPFCKDKCLLRILFAHFFVYVRNFPKQVRKAMRAIEMYQMRELLYQDRSVHRHLVSR